MYVRLLEVASFPVSRGCSLGGLRRIKMCPWIAEGCCRHGALCNYAHTPEQLRPWLPLYKTKLCDAFKRVRPRSILKKQA